MWRNLVSESIEAHYQLCSIFPPSFFFRFSWPPRAAFTARCPFLTGNRRTRCVATSLELRRILPCYSNTDILLRKSGGELSSVLSRPSGFRSISRCSWFSFRITRDLIEEIGDIGKLYMVVNPAFWKTFLSLLLTPLTTGSDTNVLEFCLLYLLVSSG